MPRKEQTPKKKTPKKKTKEKSPKKSEDPKMDAAELNRLVQNALNEAEARAEQNLEERLTALRERKDDGLEGLTHVTVYTRSGNEFEVAVSAVCECPKAAALREALNRHATANRSPNCW